MKKNPASTYLLKVNNRNTRTRSEISSKLKIKAPERRQASYWCLYCKIKAHNIKTLTLPYGWDQLLIFQFLTKNFYLLLLPHLEKLKESASLFPQFIVTLLPQLSCNCCSLQLLLFSSVARSQEFNEFGKYNNTKTCHSKPHTTDQSEKKQSSTTSVFPVFLDYDPNTKDLLGRMFFKKWKIVFPVSLVSLFFATNLLPTSPLQFWYIFDGSIHFRLLSPTQLKDLIEIGNPLLIRPPCN